MSEPPSSPSGAGPFAHAQNTIARAAAMFSGLSLVIIIIIFGWQVFGRYILNETPTWTEQLGLLLIVYISFFSGAVGVREETHLCVTLLPDMLPPRPRSILLGTADLVMAAFGAALVIYGWKLAVFGWSTNIPLLNIPDGWRTVPVVAGGAMIAGFSSLRLWSRITGTYTPPDGAH